MDVREISGMGELRTQRVRERERRTQPRRAREPEPPEDGIDSVLGSDSMLGSMPPTADSRPSLLSSAVRFCKMV